MVNKNDLGLVFGFIPLLASAGDVLQQQLSRLPSDILTWIIVLVFVWCSICSVFRSLFQNKKVRIGPFQIEYRTMLAVPTVLIVILLLL